MTVLAIETSGFTLSVAVCEDKKVLSEVFLNTGPNSSEKLLPAIDKVLKRSKRKLKQIDKIAVSTGPGSFTGIRVGLSCVKTLSQHLKIPVVGMNTLDILTASVSFDKKNSTVVFPVIDALRNEVYINGKGNIEIVGVEKAAGKLKKLKSKVILIGNGAVKYKSIFAKMLGSKAVFLKEGSNIPRASILALSSCNLKGQKYGLVKPLYIRRSWAEERKPQS
ncbi:MAG: tRNA (adenosine(37)-N6)-threonylcarbamoyltransferase complex dimerization subunit type 1 TsaB [Endomicrobiales bacterium]|nr:tRNA (adenosine(37)-N6)-threonylcarbamoyltransferase complex dimerization subunit type 1 TsaB [Endomicrobiales bacterium]